MVREVVLTLGVALVLVAPVAGADPGQVVVAALAAALAGLAVVATHHLAPASVRTPGAGSVAPLPARRDRASDPVHHPNAPRAPGLG